MSRIQRKPLSRWLGEAILIFLSVLAAFYFENYRERKKDEKEYIKTLKAFKTDLETNIGKFNFELASTYDTTDGRGLIQGSIDKLTFLDSLLSQFSEDDIPRLDQIPLQTIVKTLSPYPRFSGHGIEQLSDMLLPEPEALILEKIAELEP